MGQGARTAVVVDDDPDVRLILRVALGAGGFVVHEAETGTEGVDAVRRWNPDLVTLDLVLPGFSGAEACRRIREFTDAYIIMITSSDDEADRLVGLSLGADDYVTKPFSPREVQARVSAMFRRPRGRLTPVLAPDSPAHGASGQGISAHGIPGPRLPDPAFPVSRPEPVAAIVAADLDGFLRHGSLLLDVEGRAAWLGPVELTLTRIEFDLLVTMAGNPRRVWRREALLSTVWGGQWAEHHVVEVHMGNVRRKLGEAMPGGAQLIRTVRGVGYRLAPVVEAEPPSAGGATGHEGVGHEGAAVGTAGFEGAAVGPESLELGRRP